MPDSDVPPIPTRRPVYEHPRAVRFAHWVNAVTVTVLTMSGPQIVTAFLSFGANASQESLIDMMPPSVTLGGWLGGALQWHFTFMWLFMGTGLLYAIYQIASGHCRTVLFTPCDVPHVGPMVRHYFLFGPKPPATQQYNALQKLAYVSAVAFGAVSIPSGLAIYKPVQFSAIGWGNFASMLTGWKHRPEYPPSAERS